MMINIEIIKGIARYRFAIEHNYSVILIRARNISDKVCSVIIYYIYFLSNCFEIKNKTVKKHCYLEVVSTFKKNTCEYN